jgi:alpha-tubulin suppressor-like RCC1 family protein
MRKQVLSVLLVALVGALSAPNVFGQALSDLQGKWAMKKTSERWGEVTQTVEFKTDKFTFRVQNKAGDTLLYAKGAVKVEKLGPFKVVKLTDIEGGYSESNLSPTNDDRAIVYATGWNTLTLAGNFDQSRDGEEPEADTYKKVKE